MKDMSFGEAITTCFSKYATFTGRARRSEYWYFYLFTFVVNLACNVVPGFGTGVSGLFSLAVLIPYIAVTFRRLHDTGHSGIWYFISLIGMIPLFVSAVAGCVALFAAGYELDDYGQMASLSLGLVSIFVGLFGLILMLVLKIILLVFLCTDSQPGPNRYGNNPKEVIPPKFAGNDQTFSTSAQPGEQPSQPQSGGDDAHFSEDKMDDLRKYKQMMEEGIITADDYEKKKNELLGL